MGKGRGWWEEGDNEKGVLSGRKSGGNICDGWIKVVYLEICSSIKFPLDRLFFLACISFSGWEMCCWLQVLWSRPLYTYLLFMQIPLRDAFSGIQINTIKHLFLIKCTRPKSD